MLVSCFSLTTILDHDQPIRDKRYLNITVFHTIFIGMPVHAIVIVEMLLGSELQWGLRAGLRR